MRLFAIVVPVMNDALLFTTPAAPVEVVEADPPALEPAPGEPGPAKLPPLRRGWIRRVAAAIGSFFEWVFGATALVVGLAVLSVIPVVQLLSFGYLLESGARVARTGRLRDAFVGV